MKKLLLFAAAALCLVGCENNDPKRGEEVYPVEGRIYSIEINTATTGDFVQFYFYSDSTAMFSVLEPLSDSEVIESIYSGASYIQKHNDIELLHKTLNTPVHIKSFRDSIVYKGISYYYIGDVKTHQD